MLKRTIEELREEAGKIVKNINLNDEQNKILMLSAEYAVIMNILLDMDEELRYLVYTSLKEDFEDE